MLGTSLAVSPDGRWIAFDFGRPSNDSGLDWWTGVGLLDRASGGLRRIANPVGRRLDGPVFHHAGTHLACLSGVAGRQRLNGAALVGLAADDVREVYGPASPLPGLPIRYAASVAVQPGSGRLLISRRAESWQNNELLLVDLRRNEIETLLPKEQGAGYFSDAHFVTPTEALVRVGTPFAGNLGQEIRSHGLSNVNNVTCRLRFGETPRLLAPELERHPNWPNDVGGLGRLSVARDGTVISTSRRGLPGPGFANQVARIDIAAQRIDYLTSTPGLKNAVAVAPDGSFIAFLATDVLVRGSPFDLWTLHRQTGAVMKHNLLPRIRADRQFFLP